VPTKHHNAARYTQTDFTDRLMNLIAPSHNWQYTQETDDSHDNMRKRKLVQEMRSYQGRDEFPSRAAYARNVGNMSPAGALAPIGLVIISGNNSKRLNMHKLFPCIQRCKREFFVG